MDWPCRGGLRLMVPLMSNSLESSLENARLRRPVALPADFADRVLGQIHGARANRLWVVTSTGMKLTLATAVLVATAVCWVSTHLSPSPPAINAFSKPQQFLAP